MIRSIAMKKLNVVKKILSFLTCSALSLGLIAAYPTITEKNASQVSAKTISEIQAERSANESKIAELETKMNDLAGKKDEEKAYQDTLNEQIQLIQNNIDLLNKELDSIQNDITTAEQNIADLDVTIADQQVQIDNNVELFKQRLCAMYASGNENLAAVVVGTSTFYDMLSRIEMANRMASYDEELINDILAEIDSMETSKKNLESEKLTLEMKKEEQEKKKQEKADEMEVYYAKMQETQDEIDRIAREEELLANNKASYEAAQAELDKEQAVIEAEIKRQQEEAQRQYEERQRKLAEEKAAAEAAAKAQQQQNQSNSSNSNSNSNSSNSNTTYPIPAPSGSGFIWPAPGFSYITSGYGSRWGTTHRGIDIGDAGIHGGAVVAAKEGTVIAVNNSCTHDYAKSSSCGCGGGYGNYVVISHDGTYSTLYGHLASAAVSVGDYVSQGKVIGYAGCTGFSTGNHLHFEVRVNGSAVDPMGYVSP